MHMDPPPHATPMPADSWIIARCDGPVCVGALHVGGCELVTVRTLPRGHRSFSGRRRSSSPASPLISDREADPVQSCHSKQTSGIFLHSSKQTRVCLHAVFLPKTHRPCP